MQSLSPALTVQHSRIGAVQYVTRRPVKAGRMPADVAQLVERNLAKVEVASSSLVVRSVDKSRPAVRAGTYLFLGDCAG